MNENQLEPWMYTIHVNDPRVGDPSVPKGNGSLGDSLTTASAVHRRQLMKALPAFRSATERIGEMTLEGAVQDYVATVGGFSGKRLEAILARLGIAATPPLTLEEAGNMVGLTRERVRQLVDQLDRRLRGLVPCFMPQLDPLLDALVASAPMNLNQANEVLRAAGRVSLTVQNLLAIARLCQRDTPLELVGGLLIDNRTSRTPVADMRSIATIAKASAKVSGASNFDYLSQVLAHKGINTDRAIVETVLENIPEMRRMDEWFWFESTGARAKLVTVARKVLAIHRPQTLRSIREAFRRRLAFKKIEPTPPSHVIAEILTADPEFQVHNGLVATGRDLAPADVMGALELQMVEILMAGPGGVLTRPELMQQCYDAGLNMSSVSVYSTYSPCIERIAPGLWAARGSPVTPGALEMARERAGRQFHPLARAGGWTTSGEPWMAFEISASNINGPVPPVDSSIRHVVKGRSVDAVTQTGVYAGSIIFSDDGGAAWGFTKAIRILGAEPEDVLAVTIDLLTNRAIVKLESPEALDADD